MKLYRCDLCGRVFHKITPHVCVHGNYRKRNLTFTEFEDVDYEYVIYRIHRNDALICVTYAYSAGLDDEEQLAKAYEFVSDMEFK